jgi:hypothetical protein
MLLEFIWTLLGRKGPPSVPPVVAVAPMELPEGHGIPPLPTPLIVVRPALSVGERSMNKEYVPGVRIRFHIDGTFGTVKTGYYDIGEGFITLLHTIRMDDGEEFVMKAALLHIATIPVELPANYEALIFEKRRRYDHLCKRNNITPLKGY